MGDSHDKIELLMKFISISCLGIDSCLLWLEREVLRRVWLIRIISLIMMKQSFVGAAQVGQGFPRNEISRRVLGVRLKS